MPDGNSFNKLFSSISLRFSFKERRACAHCAEDENGRTTRTFIKMTKERKSELPMKTPRNESNVMKTITFDFIFI